MASETPIAAPLTAADVLRGTCRWLVRAGVAPLAEVPLANGRRADILGVDDAGRLTLVEIKVSLSDLRGDRKWPDYLDYCDRFFWAVPAGFPLADFETTGFAPARTGLIVADRFDAEPVREAPWTQIAAARRKAITLSLARRAAQRVLAINDPEALGALLA
ncbi:MmcB family DNA repair protein [Sandarakinorhabdus sp.]|uniref:MmcB family DNA repair protein n=1 Tax=Sandarakinorhabdus sp. TaxID=1916663 RepID=UPI00286DB0D5|nr:MmcB family DNA repair protein [Sandarakinorhabdus sp.]